MLAFPCGIDSCAGGTRQAFDQRRVIQDDRAVGDVFDHRPMIVITLQTKDDRAPGVPSRKFCMDFQKVVRSGFAHRAREFAHWISLLATTLSNINNILCE